MEDFDLRSLDKMAVRKRIFGRLKNLQSSERQLAESGLQNRLSHFLKNSSVQLWGAFHSLKTEPCIAPVLADTQGIKTFAYPRVQGGGLQYFLGELGATEKVQSSLGVLEPKFDFSKWIFASQLGGVLVPGIAFDLFGNRLGRGRGFFDRLLKKISCIRVGIAFEEQILERGLPVSINDQKLDIIVTQKRILDFRNRRDLRMKVI